MRTSYPPELPTTSSRPDEQASVTRRRSTVWEAFAYCAQRRHLSRTIRIAIAVGIILTLINQGSVIADAHATTSTWVRCALNFIVPFLVSNAGLLSARR